MGKSENKSKLAALADLRKRATSPLNPEPGKTLNPASERTRTAVNLTGGAVEALKRLQSLLIASGGVSASLAVCVALEYAAEGLPGNQNRLIEISAAAKRTDKRRSGVSS